jgi:hypothetical protein
VRLAERETTGRFETIDDSGRLMLRTQTGGLEAIAAGEVFPFDRAPQEGLSEAKPSVRHAAGTSAK